MSNWKARNLKPALFRLSANLDMSAFMVIGVVAFIVITAYFEFIDTSIAESCWSFCRENNLSQSSVSGLICNHSRSAIF